MALLTGVLKVPCPLHHGNRVSSLSHDGTDLGGRAGVDACEGLEQSRARARARVNAGAGGSFHLIHCGSSVTVWPGVTTSLLESLTRLNGGSASSPSISTLPCKPASKAEGLSSSWKAGWACGASGRMAKVIALLYSGFERRARKYFKMRSKLDSSGGCPPRRG